MNTQQKLMEDALRVITMGALLYDYLGSNAKRRIDADVEMFQTIGIKLPDFDVFCQCRDDLVELGFPTEDKLDRKLAKTHYELGYFKSSEQWRSMVAKYHAQNSVKH